MKLSYLLFILGLISFSCNKKIKSAENASKKIVLASLDNHNFDYTFYSSKANIDINSSELNIGVNAQFRIKKGGNIWFVAKKFGFEVVRAIIKSDTAKVIDRFNKRYAIASVDQLEKLGGLEDVLSYADSYLVGNIVVPKTKNKKVQLGKLTSKVHLEDGKSYEYIIDNIDYRIKEMSVIDGNKLLNIKYLSYKNIEGKKVPNKYEITAFQSGTEKLHLMISLSDISLNTKKKMPFEIPRGYSKFDL